MERRKKSWIMLLAAAMLAFCTLGAVLSGTPVRAEPTTANVTAITGMPTAGGYQIKLSFDKSGDNGNPTLLPLRNYLIGLLGLQAEDAGGGIYFSGEGLTDLEINIPTSDIPNLPRVIEFGTEMDINKGADGTSSCTLAAPARTVYYANTLPAENTIASVDPIGRAGEQLYVKFSFANEGTYTNDYLTDNMEYLLLNGVKFSDIAEGQKWYDAGTSAIGFYFPDENSENPIFRNDGNDIMTVLAGFITGDGGAIYETKTYRFEPAPTGGVEIKGAEVVSAEEIGVVDGRRRIDLVFSEYGNSHANALNLVKAGITFNGVPLAESGYDCWFDTEVTHNPYPLGHTFSVYIPEEDFKNDGTDVLKVAAATRINVEDPGVHADLADTRVIRDFVMTFEGDAPVEPGEPGVLSVEYGYMRVVGGQFYMNFDFGGATQFAATTGEDAFREKTKIEGTAKDGTPYSSTALAAGILSYFEGSEYQIPIAVSETGDKTLDLSQPIKVTLEEGLTAYTADGTPYTLGETYVKDLVPLQVEEVTRKLEGENVAYYIDFNVAGTEGGIGGFIDEYRSYVELVGEKKTGTDSWEDVIYNLSAAYERGEGGISKPINGDSEFSAAGYAGSWYEGDGRYGIFLKNILPDTVLDLTRPLKIRVRSGFYMSDNALTDPTANIPLAALAYDSEEYAFAGVDFRDLSVVSYTEELTRGAGDSTVIEIEFNVPGQESDHGAIIEQYRGKFYLNGRSINDAYWQNKVLAWYSDGKYQIHIYNDIPEDVFDFHAPITLQLKAGFLIVNPDVTNEDGYHVQAQYILREDTAVWRIKPIPEPIVIDEYTQDLYVNQISMTETTDNQILHVKFDRPVSYNVLAHINCPVDWLENVSWKADIPALPYTQAELQFVVNNGLNTSVKENIIINNMPLGVRNDSDASVYPNSIYVTYGQEVADTMTINFNKTGANRLDMTKGNEITFKAGFRTPLGGVLKEDVTFRSDPATGKWSVAAAAEAE